MERLIGSARLYLAVLQKLDASRTQADQEAAMRELASAQQHLQEAVLDIGVVVWLTHLDD
jgi:hypothetical protein